MKFKELSGMSKEERGKKLKELELELIKLNAQVATGTPPKNAGQLKRLKKDIAKMMLLKSFEESKLDKKKPVKEAIKPKSKAQSKDSLDKTKTDGKTNKKQVEKQTEKTK